MEPPNPSGLCECGCGEMAPIAPYTSKHYGWVKGQYKRFIAGHQCGGPMTPPNPSGLCFCGCGKNTPIARQSDRSSGNVKGYPTKYIHNHHTRAHGPRYLIRDMGYKTPCWIWQLSIDEHGYGKVSVKNKTMHAHRQYYTESKGRIPKGYQVDHLCFVPACVNPDHLEAVPPSVNQWRRRYIKLTPDKIPTILQIRKWGVSYKAIAVLLGVKPITIYAICKGKNWTRLEHADEF